METEKSGSSFGVKALAVIVLLVAAWVLLRVALSFIAGIAWILAVVLAIVAVIWAWRTLSSSS